MGAPNLNKQSFLADPKRRVALHQIIYRQQIILAFQKLRENRIEPILIKGWSVEQFYPQEKIRRAADIDLCVPPGDYQRAQIIAAELGFPPGSIDLHKGLRHFDKLSWDDLFRNSQLILLENAQVRVLRPEDNLRVTCIHWLNDGGADKEKLWDIYYLITHRSADFDWSRCLDANGRKRRKWILCAIAVTSFYLNLRLDGTPLAGKLEAVLPEWFIPALEKEWADEVKIVRLEKFLQERDWKSLREQLRKRFAPNPIGASIELAAPFNNWPRFPYQFADVILRFAVHFGRNLRAIKKFLQTGARKNKAGNDLNS